MWGLAPTFLSGPTRGQTPSGLDARPHPPPHILKHASAVPAEDAIWPHCESIWGQTLSIPFEILFAHALAFVRHL